MRGYPGRVRRARRAALLRPTKHLALSVGGAAIFSLYIVYDVHMISKRLSPDEYVLGAITLYLDIINLFIRLLRLLGSRR